MAKFKKPLTSLKARLLCACLVGMYGFTPTFANIDPLQVNQLIGLAVETHPLVGSALAEEKAASEGVTAARLAFLPTPSVTTTHDSQDGLVATATLRQPLWTGGRLTASVNQAIYDEKAATAYVFEQQNTVAKNAIDIWQSYIYAVALQDLYLQNLRQLAEFEAMMNRRVTQGASARIELDLVRNRILQDQNAFQGAQEQQRIAEARLEQVIGQPIGATSGNIPMALLAQYAKEQSRGFGDMAFGDASQINPSVVRQRFQVESARQAYMAQRANRYPTVYAQYSHRFLLEENENEGDFSFGMSYDPGAGFSNMALARASEARVQSLVQSQEAARRTAMEGIQTAYQQFVSARDQELSLNAAAAGASIVVASYQRQFIAGRKSWLEVLNAVREESQYRQQLLQVQAQMIASFYKLQVDFGIMPWQQVNNDKMSAPVNEFHWFTELSDWVKARHFLGEDAVASRPDDPFLISNEAISLVENGEDVDIMTQSDAEVLQSVTPPARQPTGFTLTTSPLTE